MSRVSVFDASCGVRQNWTRRMNEQMEPDLYICSFLLLAELGPPFGGVGL